VRLIRHPCVTDDPAERIVYGYDASRRESLPSAVARPGDVTELVEVVRAAYAQNLAIVPRGAGTGMVGGSVPPDRPSVVISFERMDRILEVDPKNMVARVEPGVINGRFQRLLADRGLFYPPDPASLNISTLGGNVATGAGGPKAVKYGVTRDYVLGLEIVLPDGTLTRTGVRTAKGVVGYDLTRLLVGSEGTLAIVAGITLRLLAQPEQVATLMALFRSNADSAEAVSAIMASGVTPRALEFMDRRSLEAVERYRPTGIPTEGPMLLVELDGVPETVSREAGKVTEICRKHGAEVRVPASAAAAEKLWEARRSISPALYSLRPTKINEDIAVPRSRIPEMLDRLDRLAREKDLMIVNFGHAGDGNIHVNIMTDASRAEEYERAEAAVREIFEAALELGGTLSGEHGVGLSKKPFIAMEVDAPALELMRHVKRVFDPAGLLNPGKIFPEAEEGRR